MRDRLQGIEDSGLHLNEESVRRSLRISGYLFDLETEEERGNKEFIMRKCKSLGFLLSQEIQNLELKESVDYSLGKMRVKIYYFHVVFAHPPFLPLENHA